MKRLSGCMSLAVVFTGCTLCPRTQLERAAAAGDVPEIERLLRSGAPDRLAALISAARAGGVAAIPVLVRHGADPNGTSGVNGWNVLMHAIHKNQAEGVRALLQSGADPNARAGGTTPLAMAAGYGQTEIVRILLAHNAHADAQALERAILGVADIDNWTTAKCQDDTVRLIVERNPALVTAELLSRVDSKLNRCPAVRGAVTRPEPQVRRTL
ncbi:MAG TPA: ankyrin repeat domain-containing protein [Bryobacteraceae bacterium]|nr:ankyrin repeat domain-containing protein [Bryobacteraceae bacterium]